MEHPNGVLVFDLGQTGARLRLLVAGEPVRDLSTDGYAAGDDRDDTIARLVTTAAQAFERAGFSTVVGGVTGSYGSVASVDALGLDLHTRFGVERLVVADDAVTSYLGALGDRPGVVAAIGTGVVALGISATGDAHRVEGYGAMLGDEGSGWWIGRRGLIAALSAHDGRSGGSTALLRAAEQRFGPVGDLPRAISRSASPRASVAQFAVDVATVARNGDETAISIWSRAGSLIGETIAAAATRSGHRDRVDYALTGRVARASELLLPSLEHALRGEGLDATLVPAGADGLQGAEVLSRTDDPSALGALVASTPRPGGRRG